MLNINKEKYEYDYLKLIYKSVMDPKEKSKL